MIAETKYLEFIKAEPKDPKRKTAIVFVYSRNNGSVLGQIKWFGRWRQYAFFPTVDKQTIFNKECMNDICEVIQELMVERGQRTGT